MYEPSRAIGDMTGVIYHPDNWAVVEITEKSRFGNTGYGRKEVVLYKVIAEWDAEHPHPDTGSLNSGIESVSVQGDVIEFLGPAGAVYRCNEGAYKLGKIPSQLYKQLVDNSQERGAPDYWVRLMSEHTDWSKLV